jgi:four helix bundle protein
MLTKAEQLQQRTKEFAVGSLKFVRGMANNQEHWVIGKQYLRSSTSVAANYRAACRARSRADFISKIGVVLEEADESSFWLELMLDAGTMPPNQIHPLLKEARELVAIFAATRITAQANEKNRESGIASECL